MTKNRTEDMPVIIIGAGRSGTNMLRDALTQLPGFGTWPCDEINYIWRHGNVGYPTDELSPSQATEPVQRFIRHAFEKLAKQQHVQYVVEKTCANSLRVCFVDAIIPRAKYIFVVRDGRDVIASALKRWSAPLELPYILKKARFVPISDMPYYGARYLGNRIYRLLSRENRLAFWGPRFEGMIELLQTRTLPEVCAYQWRRCIERSTEDFALIDRKRVYQLRYENLVQQPQQELQQILDFLEMEITTTHLQQLTQDISTSSIGKWQSDLTPEVISLINPIIQPLLEKYGYR